MATLRVLVTGSEGFIGQVLCRSLEHAGHEVYGFDRMPSAAPDRRQVDLLDREQVEKAFAAMPPCDAIIHTAAVAHEERLPAGETRVGINTATTQGLLGGIGNQDPHFIFLSSVAVYGEAGRPDAVRPDADLRPSTDYGRSKQLCEQLILASPLTRCDILRCTPVFDVSHLKDVRKRAFLPGLKKLKIRMIPPPRYSLCHVDTLAKTIVGILEQPPIGRRVRNVADDAPYSQRDILSRFPGAACPFPTVVFEPFRAMTYLLPPKLGYKIRCLHHKLLRSNVYDTELIENV
jgi:nucleoside-diphosphate-sugar epimerase